MSISDEHVLVLSPLGRFEKSFLKILQAEIEELFKWKCTVIRLIPDIRFSLDPVRKQYYSTLILKKLADQSPHNAVKVIGLTDVDLFIPIFTYVYGEAQLGGKACIVSTYRLKEGVAFPTDESDIFLARTIKEVLHELGHTFNLKHCPDPTCIMHYCRSIQDVDRKANRFCRYCRILLEDEIKREYLNLCSEE